MIEGLDWADLLQPHVLLAAAVLLVINAAILLWTAWLLAAMGRAFFDAIRGKGID